MYQVQTDNFRSVDVVWKTQPGLLYELESGSGLAVWASAYSQYGMGQQINARVRTGPATPENPSPPTLTLPQFSFVVNRLSGGASSLVSWRDTGGQYSAQVALSFVISGLPPVWDATITPTAPDTPYRLSFFVNTVTYQAGQTPPVTDPLPPAQQVRLNKLTAAYAFLQANPQGTPGAAGGPTTTLAGADRYYRVRVAYTDSDGDGLYDHQELNPTDPAHCSNPFLADSDGDGYSDADEYANGTTASHAASKPFDPMSPPAAQWYVGTMEAYWPKFLRDPGEVLFSNQVAQVTAAATALADGSFDLPFLSVQAAVNAAQPGDIIQLAPGTYTGGINLTARNVKIIGMAGQREATIISGGVQGLDFGAANTAATVISGLTIRGATGAALRLQNGASPTIANCVLDANATGIQSTASSPRIFNTVINGSTSATALGNGVVVSGGSVRLTHCTLINNARQTNSGQIRATGNASVEVLSSLIRSDGLAAPGPELVATPGSVITVTRSNVTQAIPGVGNLTAAPLFDAAFPIERRLQRLSPGVDQADAAGLPGYRYWTRLDFDGEQRGPAYNVPAAATTSDMGADEFVSRLTFATYARNIDGAAVQMSQVDEASDVAALGTVPGTGDARIAIVNDETIEEVNPAAPATVIASHNEISLFTLSATTGDISATQIANLRRGVGGANEIKDPEALCWDPANQQLYVVTSQTKVNKYRDCEGTTLDPLLDPPVNDYDPRRCVLARYAVDGALNAGALTYYDGTDGPWAGVAAANRRDMDAFQQGLSLTSPTGFDSGTGLVASLRAGIQGNATFPALQALTPFPTGVLIAWSTSPKFGTPVNGTQYPAGTALPYTGLGATAATAGTSLGNQAAAPGTAGVTHTGRAANTTYYYKAWAYDAAFNYSRPLEAQTITTGDPPLLVNEIEGAGTDFIEVFNASGVAVNLNGLRLLDDGGNGGLNPPFPIPQNTPNIAARGTVSFGGFGFGIGNGSDDGRILGVLPNPVFTQYGTFTRNQQNGNAFWNLLPNAEGRIWDGGPRGLTWSTAQGRFEAKGAIYRSSAGSPQPITSGATNNAGVYKYFQATADANQNTIYLHYGNLGTVPAVWSYSPKSGDGHPISVESMAYRSPTEMIVGLRSPLSNRTTGNALFYVINNVATFLPAGNWNGAAPAVGAPQQLNLNGQGIRSLQWVPTLNNSAGAYLIIGGPANGGPLKVESGREVFTLYQWAGPGAQPVIRIPNLRPYTQRPEGVNVISFTVNGVATQRLLFVEDRYRALGYGARNAIHWPMSILQ
jgi:Bacterial TSP3 repeat